MSLQVGVLDLDTRDLGRPNQDAVAEAMRVGLRSAELMERALEYVRSRQGI